MSSQQPCLQIVGILNINSFFIHVLLLWSIWTISEMKEGFQSKTRTRWRQHCKYWADVSSHWKSEHRCEQWSDGYLPFNVYMFLDSSSLHSLHLDHADMAQRLSPSLLSHWCPSNRDWAELSHQDKDRRGGGSSLVNEAQVKSHHWVCIHVLLCVCFHVCM